jgi:hypothetical protein
MTEQTLQEQLVDEFFNELNFGFDPHFFAARDEIRNLRNRVAELEAQLSEQKAATPARVKRSGVKAE